MTLCTLLLLLAVQDRAPEGCELKRDVVYGKGGDVDLKCDVWFPKERSADPIPGVLYIHGGGWTAGDKNHPQDIAPLVRRGYCVVSINYRLAPKAIWPAQIEDCKCAVRWLRANAKEMKIDPDRMGAWGGSAGGHLAMLLAYCDDKTLEGKGGHEGVSSKVQACCSWYGPAQVSATFKLFSGATEDFTKIASPVTHIDKSDPPTLFVHGEEDSTVKIEQSELALKALKAAGVDAELVRVANAGHVFKQVGKEKIAPSKETIDTVTADFFDKTLKKR
jgi:acetyl esterase/lipase